MPWACKKKEQHAIELMLTNTNPKDAMRISGLNYVAGDKDYRRIYQKVRRKRKKIIEMEQEQVRFVVAAVFVVLIILVVALLMIVIN